MDLGSQVESIVEKILPTVEALATRLEGPAAMAAAWLDPRGRGRPSAASWAARRQSQEIVLAVRELLRCQLVQLSRCVVCDVVDRIAPGAEQRFNRCRRPAGIAFEDNNGLRIAHDSAHACENSFFVTLDVDLY